MRIKIKDQELLLPVQVVSLQGDGLKSFLFRCDICGTQVTRIKGKVVSIVPGAEVYADTANINRCPKCHQNYVFIERGKFKKALKVTLTASQTLTNFFCVYCYEPVVNYSITQISRHYDSKVYKPPLTLACSNCETSYEFVDIVTLWE